MVGRHLGGVEDAPLMAEVAGMPVEQGRARTALDVGAPAQQMSAASIQGLLHAFDRSWLLDVPILVEYLGAKTREKVDMRWIAKLFGRDDTAVVTADGVTTAVVNNPATGATHFTSPREGMTSRSCPARSFVP